MADISALKTNLGFEEDGIWISWIHKVRFKIRRLGNTKFEAYMRSVLRGGRISEEDEEWLDLARRGVAKYVLLDWNGLEEDGETVIYSPEKAEEFFADRELRDMYLFIIREAQKAENFRKEDFEEAKGN